jgi:hypothetical protein
MNGMLIAVHRGAWVEFKTTNMKSEIGATGYLEPIRQQGDGVSH